MQTQINASFLPIYLCISFNANLNMHCFIQLCTPHCASAFLHLKVGWRQKAKMPSGKQCFEWEAFLLHQDQSPTSKRSSIQFVGSRGIFLGKGCCNCNTFATGGGSISKVYLESYDFSKSSELDFSCNTKMSVALRKNCNTKITRISIANFSVPKKLSYHL